MSRSMCVLLFLLFCVPTFTASQQSEAKDSEVQALKADAQRMRVILNQMRTNLAFVDTTQSPLKHQFELEADLWQVTLEQMDRRIAALESSQGEPRKK